MNEDEQSPIMVERRKGRWTLDENGNAVPEKSACPFVIAIDTREQAPYAFAGLKTNKREGSKPLLVATERVTLRVGDYSIVGPLGGLPHAELAKIILERKSKEDLFGSIARRENFWGRLVQMSRAADYEYAAVVVEAEIREILTDPPAHSDFNPKSLIRTITAWAQRLPAVHWWFLPGRTAAEAFTFRLLERFYLDRLQAGEWQKSVIEEDQ